MSDKQIESLGFQPPLINGYYSHCFMGCIEQLRIVIVLLYKLL